MTASELMAHESHNTRYQLAASIQDLPERIVDAKLADSSMSPRETVAHLCESYEALSDQLEGREHEWGSFNPDGYTWEQLQAKMFELRDAAAVKVLSGGDDSLKAGHDYIVAHDAYHVGQLCALRIAKQPDWVSYSIYRFE